jgi:hypothetical protein
MALGTVCYVLCFLSHVCMAGHMQHGPYHASDWINDLLWSGCFVSVGVFSVPLHRKRRDLLVVGSVLLVFSRIFLASLGGAVLIELVNLERLRARGLSTKRSLALREFALGIESLERFVRKEPLRRVHECVFGVLALESEPVDPRL